MFLADLHIHSRFSRATSKNCAPETLDLSAREKGLHVIGTGDFTHPAWRAELKEKLRPAEEGLYRLREKFALPSNVCGENFMPRFLLSCEISSIYKKNGRTRKVHNVILLPSLEKTEVLSKKLEAIGNLHSDGRPILGLDSRDLLELTLEACPEAIFIPAHIWTPHFSLFGAYSGFDAIEECFEDLTPHIHALETGLSSDPPMNWRLSALDHYTLVSNSDAHSPAKLAREANIFNTSLSYPAIAHALAHPETEEFYGTLEFFPEEGKYHFDGHRNCGVCLSPEQSLALDGLCPVCKKRLTTGVSHRVGELADHPLGRHAPHAKHFESIVPLCEALGSCLGLSASSVKVRALREALLQTVGPELYLLREAPLEQIQKEAGTLVAEGLRRLRAGQVEAQPGFDGEYGKVQLLSAEQRTKIQGQLSFFAAPLPSPARKNKMPEPAPQQKERMSAAVQEPSTEHYGLNALQWQAASSSSPVTAVIAGPGTGKTRTLVARAAYLISDCAVPASHITAVTFTNQAAVEMRERLAAELGRGAIRTLTIGTFHAICYTMLKKWHMSLPVLEEADALLLCQEVIKSLGIKASPRHLLHRISSVKNGMLLASELPAGAMAQYSALLEQYHVMDYDDILIKAIAMLEEGGKKIQKSLAAFSHILVDEFQDINLLQYRLLRLWSRSGGSLFCIGDPNQSIYGFRGADATCFSRLASDYPKVKQISLEENYRSSPEILGCAQPVVRSKALQATQPSGEKVQVAAAKSALSEGIFVAHQIIERMGGIDMLGAHSGKKKAYKQSLGFSDIAILYRTHRQAAQIEYCLKKEGIPYIVIGREDFLSAPAVRHALCFFRFLLEPKNLLARRHCLEAAGCPEQEALAFLGASDARALLASTRTPALQGLRELVIHFSPLTKAPAQQLLLEFAKRQGLTEDPDFERLLCAASANQSLPDFLSNIALGQENDFRRSGNRSYPLDAVTLCTLHGAKGLEFDTVFLCGANKGLLPLQHVGTVDPGEERRLFYVGMTRAKTSLTLCYYGEPSPFLSELPAGFFETRDASERKKILAKQLSLFE